MKNQIILSKKQKLYFLLFGLILTSALIAEMIGAKIFSLEDSMGISPVNLEVYPGIKLDFNLTAGVLIWPVVFIISDLVNEYFGREGVQQISLWTAFFIILAFIFVYWATELKPASFWLEINSTDAMGRPFDINYAFKSIFRQGMGIIVGSISAFLLGQFIDAFVFQKIRQITGDKWIGLRATGSTIISQCIDSFVVLYVAFYVFGNWTLNTLFAVGTMNFIYKMSVAILLTPVLYFFHFLIEMYLGMKK